MKFLFSQNRQFHLGGVALAFIAYAMLGTYAIFGKVLVEHISQFLIILINELLGGIILLLFMDFSKKLNEFRNKKTKDYVYILLLATLTAIIAPLLFLTGLTLTSATNAVLIGRAEVLLTTIFAILLLKDKITLHQVIGSIIMLLGIVLIATQNFQNGFEFNIGDALIIGAALSLAIATVIFKKHLQHIEPEVIVTVRNIFGASILFVISLFVLDISDIAMVFDWKNSTLILGLVMCTIVFGQSLYYKALELTSAVNVSLAGLCSPLLAIVYAMLFLGERLEMSQILGGSMIILGLIVLEFHFHKNHPSKTRMHHMKIRRFHF